jgi:hypothetical protein
VLGGLFTAEEQAFSLLLGFLALHRRITQTEIQITIRIVSVFGTEPLYIPPMQENEANDNDDNRDSVAVTLAFILAFWITSDVRDSQGNGHSHGVQCVRLLLYDLGCSCDEFNGRVLGFQRQSTPHLGHGLHAEASTFEQIRRCHNCE